MTWLLLAVAIVLPTPDRAHPAGCPQFIIRKQLADGTPCVSGEGCTYHVFQNTEPCPTPEVTP